MQVRVRFHPSGLRGSTEEDSAATRSFAARSIATEPIATVTTRAGTTLLAAARLAQLPIASGCGADGMCGRCGLRVLDGAAALSVETTSEARAKARNRIDPALRLACQTLVAGDVEVASSYW